MRFCILQGVKKMNKINIGFITDEALETLYKNSNQVAEYLKKEGLEYGYAS